MPQSDRCPACGAELPRGVSPPECPRCLLRLALEPEGEASTVENPPGVGAKRLGQVGPYKLLAVLGEGGMGVVYLAEQQEPIRRRVALKLIKRGMDTREVIARFESERQALALMSHHGIASVLDAGTSEDGRPFFVMEHVAGVWITEYCDRHSLDSRARLALFHDVCEAVQHAHQKGIVHRDIKPSNILVSVEEGRPRPKIIDFGVAKAIAQRLTEKTVFTQQGVMVGTPGYMSPEQAEVTGLDIDIRTDIYSLGVVLYELLAGAPPFDPKRLREAGWLEMQRIIREEEPPRLSTRVSRMGATAAETARRRKTDPATLRKQLRGDLEWITLKTLEKDRTRRYQSATELAADIRRHLDNEPVMAGPPSAVYRLRKLVRRHRGLVTAAAAILVTLLAGLVTSSGLYLREQAARKETRKQLVKALVSRGTELLDRADPLQALPWLLRALELEEGDQTAHRLRLQSVLDQTPKLIRLWAHAGAVHHAEFSRDGKLVVSASADRTARVWSVESGEAQTPPLAHQGQVLFAAFDTQGKRVATASEDGMACIWSVAEGRLLTEGLKHEGKVVHLTFDPGGKRLLTVAADGWVRSWHTETGELTWKAEYGKAGERVVVSRQGDRAAVLGGTTVQILDTATGRTIHTLKRNDYAVRTAQFTPDGRRLAAGAGDGFVTIWELGTPPKLAYEFKASGVGMSTALVPLALDPGGTFLAAGGSSRTVKLWNLGDGRERSERPLEHDAMISHVQVPAANIVLTVSQDGAARLWNTVGVPITTLLRPGTMTLASVAPNLAWLLTAGRDGLVRVLSLPAGVPPVTVLPHEEYVSNAAYDPSGQRLATGSGVSWGYAQIWDAATGQEVSGRLRHRGRVAVALTRDGQRLVSFSDDRTLVFWDARTGHRLIGPIEFPAPVRNVVLDAAGRFAAAQSQPTGTEDLASSVRLVDVSSGNVQAIGEDGELAWGFAFGDRLVTSNGPSARFWEIPSAVLSMELPHDSPVAVAAVSRDGALLATATKDAQVRVWDIRTRRLVAALHTLNPVSQIEFSPRADRLALSGTAGIAGVWDVASARRLFEVSHHGAVYKASFSPDGRWLLTVSHDGTARVWDAGTGERITPSLRHRVQVPLRDGSFAPDGRGFVTTGNGAHVWRFVPTQLSIADLRHIIELHSGLRFAEGQPVAISSDVIATLWRDNHARIREALAASRTQALNFAETLSAFGNMMQRVDARRHRGRVVRVSAWIRVQADPTGQAYMWLLVNREKGQRGYFDNMADRRIKESTWSRYTLEGPVARDAVDIRYGIILQRAGRACVDDVTVEVVDKAGTQPTAEASNLDFEEGEPGEHPPGWTVHGAPVYQVRLSPEAPHSGKQCAELLFAPPSLLTQEKQ